MTDLKKGDRVRLVHEGVVTAVERTWLTLDGTARLLGKGETVELIEKATEPLPIGTTIVYAGVPTAYPLIRDRDGWRNHAGERVSGVTDERVRSGRFNILYEPQAS